MKQQIQVKVATWMVSSSSSSSASNWTHLDLIDWLRCHYHRWRWTPPFDEDFVALGDLKQMSSTTTKPRAHDIRNTKMMRKISHVDDIVGFLGKMQKTWWLSSMFVYKKNEKEWIYNFSFPFLWMDLKKENRREIKSF